MSDAAIAPLLVSETRGLAVTTERLPVRVVLITVAVIFLVLFLLLPLARRVRRGLPRRASAAYFAAITEPDAVAAIKLTLLVAAIAVPANLIFGLAASWAIAKFEFTGKSLLNSLIDLPFSVSPVISGLIYVLLFGLQGFFGPWLQSAQYPDHLRASRHRARHHLRHLPLRRPRARSADAGARHAGRGGGACRSAPAAGRPSSG